MGKERMTLRTDSGVILGGGAGGPWGREGRGAWGCLANISLSTSGEALATPSERRAWRAFLYWPSC